MWASGDRSLPPPFPYQLTAEIPSPSGYADPIGIQSPPFSYLFTRAHSAYVLADTDPGIDAGVVAVEEFAIGGDVVVVEVAVVGVGTA